MPPKKKPDPVPGPDEGTQNKPEQRDAPKKKTTRRKTPAKGAAAASKKTPVKKEPVKKGPTGAAKKSPKAPAKKRATKAPMEKATVDRFMTDGVHRVDAGASLNDAARLMWENDIGVVPVVGAEGRPEGVVTDRDIAMAAYLKGRPLQGVGVHEVMSTSVQSARAGESVTEACDRMARHQVRRLPVVDDEGLLVGMLSMKDLVDRPGGSGIPDPEVAATLRAICAPRGTAAGGAAQ